MKIDPAKVLLSIAGLLMLTGCGGHESSPPAATPPAAVNAPPPPPPPPPAPTESSAPAAPVAPPPSATANDAPPAAPNAPEPERQKADVGIGSKGHYQQGILTTPLSVYFRAEEMVTFQMKIPKVMQLFQATENRLPKSQAEFMQLLKDNDIVLPQLPPGRRYFYDPKTGELMVEEPAR
jgi:hypothetical protein